MQMQVKPFQIPEKNLNEWKKIGKKGEQIQTKWDKVYKNRKKK